MGTQLYSLAPLQPFPPIESLPPDPTPLEDPPDVQQLKTDTCNVVEGRVPLDSFTPEYQEKIKNFYRYSATRCMSSVGVIAKRTNDTIDIV